MFLTLLTILLTTEGTAILSGGFATIAVQILSFVSLGGVVFMYTVWRNYKKDTEEKETKCKKEADDKEYKLRDEIKHLTNQCSNHTDMFKINQMEREHLVDTNNQKIADIKERLKEVDSLKTDVDLMKAEQKLQGQMLSFIKETMLEMKSDVKSIKKNG